MVLYLIDVSEWNGEVDFRAVKRSGVAGVWVKATEGTGFTDARFVEHYAAARNAGLRVGAYHYAHPDLGNIPEAEANHFVNTIGRIERRDLRPVLDLEVKTSLPSRGLEMWAHRFCFHVKQGCGALPIFYSYTSYIEGHFRYPIGAGLWLANYDGVLHVTTPAPWRRFVAHQYTDHAIVPGVPGKCDKSWAPKLRPLLAHPITGLL